MKSKQYKYYSLRRPVSPGTFPAQKGVTEILNYPTRLWVEKGRYEAWGEFTTNEALSSKEMHQYELAPACTNPDIQSALDSILPVVGQFETEFNVPESKRCTWFCPDIGYLWSQWATDEQLLERYKIASVREEAKS